MLDFTKEFKEIKILSAVFWYVFTMIIVILVAFIIYLSSDINLIDNDNLLSLISTVLFIIVLLYKFRVNKNKLLLMIKDYKKKNKYKRIMRCCCYSAMPFHGHQSIINRYSLFYFSKYAK